MVVGLLPWVLLLPSIKAIWPLVNHHHHHNDDDGDIHHNSCASMSQFSCPRHIFVLGLYFWKIERKWFNPIWKPYLRRTLKEFEFRALFAFQVLLKPGLLQKSPKRFKNPSAAEHKTRETERNPILKCGTTVISNKVQKSIAKWDRRVI